jgi:hypothetical protein
MALAICNAGLARVAVKPACGLSEFTALPQEPTEMDRGNVQLGHQARLML